MKAETNIQKDVVIVGGGITGLSTAYRLARGGAHVLVLEKSPRPGGAVLSEHQDGFLIDCGPNSTLETSPKMRQFVDDLGLSENRVYASEQAKKRYVVRGGRLVPLPMNPGQFLTSKLFSAGAKLRLLREPFIPPAPEHQEETIAQFVRRRLGREFLDYAINPFVAGVYAGDPERLSVRSAVAKIYALEKNYGSLIKGAIKGARERKRRTDVDKTRARLFSFRNGMGELIHALANKLGDSVELSAELTEIRMKANGFHLRYRQRGKRISVVCKSLLFTTPAYVTAGYVAAFDRALANELNAIHYPPVVMLFAGFRKPAAHRPLDGFGFLMPQVERRNILGTIWSSTLFPERAPQGGMALTTFIGGMRQPELCERDDDELLALVRAEFKRLLALDGSPDVVRIMRWPRAIPQYEIGHEKKIAAIQAFEERHAGWFIAGNFRGGISLGDCILNSEQTGEKILAFLRQEKETQPRAQPEIV